MADEPTVEGAINESLIRDLDAARKERDDLRALVGRPVTVTVNGPDAELMKKIEAHLPKLSQMPEHLATIAGELIKAAKQRADEQRALHQAVVNQTAQMARIALALEQLIPTPKEEPDA